MSWSSSGAAPNNRHLTSAALRQDLSLQHITNVSWAYASLGVVAPRLTAALRAEVARRAASQQLSAQQLCNLLWAFAQLRVSSQSLQVAMATLPVKLSLAFERTLAGANIISQYSLATALASSLKQL